MREGGAQEHWGDPDPSVRQSSREELGWTHSQGRWRRAWMSLGSGRESLGVWMHESPHPVPLSTYGLIRGGQKAALGSLATLPEIPPSERSSFELNRARF